MMFYDKSCFIFEFLGGEGIDRDVDRDVDLGLVKTLRMSLLRGFNVYKMKKALGQLLTPCKPAAPSSRSLRE